MLFDKSVSTTNEPVYSKEKKNRTYSEPQGKSTKSTQKYCTVYPPR